MSATVPPPVSTSGSAGSAGAAGAGPGRRLGGDNPWIRRIATTAVLLLAAGILAYGCSVGESADDSTGNSVIVAQYPAAGGRALRQTEVGALLEMGYDGRLIVNGVEIPEEQMEGALDPNDPVNAEDIELYGVRPNNRNRVVFRPGPGKVIEEFEQGEVTITLRYFPDRRDDGANRVTSWTITVA